MYDKPKRYHYSPKTGKIEECRALTPETCRYTGTFHTEDYDAALEYQDQQNELFSKLNNFEKIYYTGSAEKDYEGYLDECPTSRRRDKGNTFQPAITMNALRYLESEYGFAARLLMHWEGVVDFVPTENVRSMNQYLSIKRNLERIVNELNADLDYRRAKGEPVEHGSAPYDLFDITRILSTARNHGIVDIGNKLVPKKGTDGKFYTLRSFWKNYLDLLEKQGRLELFSKNGRSFYAIRYRDPDNPSLIERERNAEQE